VIRQAISCDICGAEKKQTNHWFVAYEQRGELRLSGWQSKLTLRPKVKHLCGQKCVHRLMDEFMAAVSSVADAAGTILEKPVSEYLADVDEGAVLVKKDTSLINPAEPRNFTSESWNRKAWEHERKRQSYEEASDSEIVSRSYRIIS
jgi:hypothetical protein